MSQFKASDLNNHKLGRKLPPIQVVIEEVLTALGFEEFDITLQSSTIPGHVSYNITGPESPLLIGFNGRNLESLSKVVREVVTARAGTLDSHYELENYIVDVEGYQEKQMAKLIAEVAAKIESLRSAPDLDQMPLAPMSPFHRRVVHAYAQGQPGITTQSDGVGHQRKVIIMINE